jgi:hypothetical protein
MRSRRDCGEGRVQNNLPVDCGYVQKRLAEIAISEIRTVKESGALAASGTRPAITSWPLLNGRENACEVDDQGWSELNLIP